MTPEERKVYLEAAQVCDNIAELASVSDWFLQEAAHGLAVTLRSRVKADEDMDGASQ